MALERHAIISAPRSTGSGVFSISHRDEIEAILSKVYGHRHAGLWIAALGRCFFLATRGDVRIRRRQRNGAVSRYRMKAAGVRVEPAIHNTKQKKGLTKIDGMRGFKPRMTVRWKIMATAPIAISPPNSPNKSCVFLPR